VIAWDAGREATRALHDALPFLLAADEVVVMVINPFERETDHGAAPGADIGRHLVAHGVTTETEVLQVKDLGVMDMLLSRLADRGTNLLVMGAHAKYGFPHVHEGGGTRHILAHMTTPVLLSN
jgi:nucleotide-binding universal stress UspA family protein